MKRFNMLFLALLICLAGAQTGISEVVRTDQVAAELVSENKTLVPGTTNTVAIRLEMEDHWHTYWENPGDSGLPTTVDWTLPDGITAGPLQWPVPQWINYFDMITFAYEEEVFLLVDLEVSEDFKIGNTVDLAASVSWLACKEACIPGSADLKLSLQLSKESESSSFGSAIASTRKALPQQLDGWEMKVVDNGESFALSVLAPEGSNLEKHETTFFTLDGWVSNAGPRTSFAEGRLLTVILPKSEYAPDDGQDRFKGVLASNAAWDVASIYNTLAIDLPFSDDEAVAAWVGQTAGLVVADGQPFQNFTADSPNFLTALLFALVGGILLNLMPCVFPVLSIKILGFVQQAGDDHAKVKVHGMVFTLGVLVSFWILAGLFLILRAAGQEIGWGFQLQLPGFVAVLASVMFLFGLNLSGVFEIGESLTGAGGQLQSKSGYAGSFFSGVLATLVATPCTAPFMGSALGIIVTLSAVQSMLIFTALALGVAFPYLFLSFFPAFLKWLPRPGAWMETFKNGLAFLLYATVVWLAWVFGKQVGVTGMAGLLLGMVFLGVAAWIWGNWGNLAKKKTVRLTAFLVALPLLLIGGWIQFYASTMFAESHGTEISSKGNGIQWAVYDPELVVASTAEGKTVYVDFTATWCLTCQVNKQIAFGSDKVVDYFKSNNIVALKGDWTRRDPVITRELQKFGRSGVPTNIIYRPDGSSNLLPEVLTPGVVLEALNEGS